MSKTCLFLVYVATPHKLIYTRPPTAQYIGYDIVIVKQPDDAS